MAKKAANGPKSPSDKRAKPRPLKGAKQPPKLVASGDERHRSQVGDQVEHPPHVRQVEPYPLIEGIKVYPAEALASPDNSLTADELQQILEIVTTVERPPLPPEPAKRQRGRPGSAYERTNDDELTVVDFGLYRLEQRKGLCEIRLVRADGGEVLQGFPLEGNDPSVVAQIRKSLVIYGDRSQTATARITARELLQVWSFLDKALETWRRTHYFSFADTQLEYPYAEQVPMHVRPPTGGPVFPVDLLVKLAIWCGSLIERQQVHPDEQLALQGRQHATGRSKGGKNRAVADAEKWRQRLSLVSKLIDDDQAQNISDACRQVATDELKQEGRLTGSNYGELESLKKQRAKSIARGLAKLFPDDVRKFKQLLKKQATLK